MRSLLFALLLLAPLPAFGQCAGGSCGRPFRPMPIRPGTVYRPIAPQIRYSTFAGPTVPTYIYVWTQRGWVLVRLR